MSEALGDLVSFGDRQLIAYANLSESVAFAGLGKKFQIWEPNTLKERQTAAMKARQEKQRAREALQTALGIDGRRAGRDEA